MPTRKPKKARAGKQTVTRKAGAAIAQAVTTVRKALVGAPTGAVTGAVHARRPQSPQTLSRWNRQPR
jgi:hypothetical protein